MRQKDPVLTFLLTYCVKTIRQRRIADSTEKNINNEAKSKYSNLSLIFPDNADNRI